MAFVGLPEAASSWVREMIERMTDPKGGMATELTAVINQTFPTILNTLVRMKKIRLA